MSSLGVTDCFPMDNFNCSDDDLVLGMYPLTIDVGPHWQDIPIILEQEPNGTMLPFRRFDLADTAMSGTITCCFNLPV